jgi:hypothetical protein
MKEFKIFFLLLVASVLAAEKISLFEDSRVLGFLVDEVLANSEVLEIDTEEVDAIFAKKALEDESVH